MLAAEGFVGTYKTADTEGKPFTIWLSDDGSAKGDRANEGLQGMWKEEGNAAVVTWDTEWTTKITKDGDKYVKTTLKDGKPVGKPADRGASRPRGDSLPVEALSDGNELLTLDHLHQLLVGNVARGAADASDPAQAQEAEFALLKQITGASDSVVSKHLSALTDVGYVALRKAASDGRQRTWARLTSTGRAAFRRPARPTLRGCAQG